VTPPVHIDAKDVAEHLGRQKFFFEAAERTSVARCRDRLALPETGGDVLFIEASAMDGGAGVDAHRTAR